MSTYTMACGADFCSHWPCDVLWNAHIGGDECWNCGEKRLWEWA